MMMNNNINILDKIIGIYHQNEGMPENGILLNNDVLAEIQAIHDRVFPEQADYSNVEDIAYFLTEGLGVDEDEIWLVPSSLFKMGEGTCFFGIGDDLVAGVSYKYEQKLDRPGRYYLNFVELFVETAQSVADKVDEVTRAAKTLKSAVEPSGLHRCPKGGDISNKCEDCTYSADYYFSNGKCLRRPDNRWARVGMGLQLTEEETKIVKDGGILNIGVMVAEGRAWFDGDSYFPNSMIEENDGLEGVTFLAE